MPDTPDYSWPAIEKRQVHREAHQSRLDGSAKSSGRTKYSLRHQPPGHALRRAAHLPARACTNPCDRHQRGGEDAGRHGRRSDGEAGRGNSVRRLRSGGGRGHVRATRPATPPAKIKVDYEVLPHLVNERTLPRPGKSRQGVRRADHRRSRPGVQGSRSRLRRLLRHPGSHALLPGAARPGDRVEGRPVRLLAVHAERLRRRRATWPKRSRFRPPTFTRTWKRWAAGSAASSAPDRWGNACAQLSKKSGGRPVKLFLDRATELEIAGNRPSFFAKIKVGGEEGRHDDRVAVRVLGDRRHRRQRACPRAVAVRVPRVPNKRMKHTSVIVNAAPQRAWRAPNHPQLSYLTCTRDGGLRGEAEHGRRSRSSSRTRRLRRSYRSREVYRAQLQKAAELAEWKKLWHPRGQAGDGPVKRGLGIGVNMWCGLGHASKCRDDDSPGRLGGSGDRQPGSRHRHPHGDRDGGGRNARAAAERGEGEDRRQQVPAVGRIGRIDDGGRRFGFDAQVHHERAGEAVRGSCACARNARRTNSRPWTARSR